MANKTNMVEAPLTPGRPVFSFSVGSRKGFPSKWDDAEKWLISGPVDSVSRQCGKHHEKEKLSVYRLPTSVSMDQDHPSHVLLKDGEEERFKDVGFVLSSMKDASTEVVKRRDTGGCPTPYRSVSPPRHTTPASMSGPLALINATSSTSFDIADLHGCHLAKLQLQTCNWTSREEEEQDVSKSLRHNQSPKTIPPSANWEQEQKARSHLRYQREEAKIEAWVNLQNAKAEAQSRKLEVKIQKMRSKFEEKMMKKMASVDRKAEEMRAAAQYEYEHTQSHETLHGHGGCFPCSPIHHL